MFVTLTSGYEPDHELRKELKLHVREKIGALAVPAGMVAQWRWDSSTRPRSATRTSP